MTKAQNAIVAHYNSSINYYGTRSIYKAYTKPSSIKVEIWESIVHQCSNKGGYGLTVISNNSFIFTAGYKYNDESGEEYLVYITPSKDEIIRLND